MWRCAPWSSTSPAARCRRASCPIRSCDPARPGEVLVEVHACGVCRTDLHIRDGELRGSQLPAGPRPPDRRHRAGGRARGRARAGRARRHPVAGLDRRDVPLLHAAGARTSASARASPASTVDGGYASCAVADARYCLRAARGLRRPRGRAAAVRRAHRPPRAADDRRRASASGSTASAPAPTSSAQVARHQGRRVFAFTRAGDERLAGVRARARLRVGGRRAGPGARGARRGDHLRPRRARSCRRRCARVERGGVVVCAGIHMSDIPSFPYELLWGERVAALGRQPHARRRRRVPRPRAAGAGAHPRDDLRARRGRARRWTRPARRARSRARRCSSRSLAR